ncbi:DUF6197 family protein [Mycobacteroides chelonae]|uniref:DUF6197 family protein n=1 Tax=Mycobacteroides chelonae TaxID=1774 RepID=UPI0009925541|nr:hypothetical protein [Mycobacteroides chelonae]
MSAPTATNPTVEVLQAALALLRKNGWRQRRFGDYGQPCCTVGAFIYSGSDHPWTTKSGVIDRALSLVSQSVGGPTQVVEPFLYQWNDADGRTFVDIETAFERAIELAEADGR